MFADFMGPDGEWCWIKKDGFDPAYYRDILCIFTFYMFFWLAMIINFSIAICIPCFKRNDLTNSTFFDIQVLDYIRNKLILIPILMSVCWIIPTIDRISNFLGYSNDYLSIIHSFATAITGFLNSIIYALSPGTWELFKSKCSQLIGVILGIFKRKSRGKKERKKEMLIEKSDAFLTMCNSY